MSSFFRGVRAKTQHSGSPPFVISHIPFWPNSLLLLSSTPKENRLVALRKYFALRPYLRFFFRRVRQTAAVLM